MAPEAVILRLPVHSKKHAIQEISAVAARQTGMPEREVFDTLLQRERLGSTGVGNGIAIPHGKLVGLDKIYGFFFRLAEPIEFEALDDQPVDLIFALLAPEEAGADHLKALAKIARVLRTPGMTDELRNADTATDVFELITRTPAIAG
nr:PTS IIA-like nitrogen regulatory protein PtsN [Acuticoccus mangrovi]